MSNKTVSILSYITWVGWILAFIFKDKNNKNVLLHVNQGFILHVVNVVAVLIGQMPWWICSPAGTLIKFGILVLCIVGIYHAVKEIEEPIPIVGEFASPDREFFKKFTGRY